MAAEASPKPMPSPCDARPIPDVPVGDTHSVNCPAREVAVVASEDDLRAVTEP